jgi:chloramphenicol O-acetyltransferase type B
MVWWKKTGLPKDRLLLSGSAEQGWTGMVGRSPITVGRFSYGAEKATIKEWGEGAALQVGSFCSIADGLSIFLGGNHRSDWASTFPFGHIFRDQLGGQDIVGHPRSRGDVIIGNDVWIGANVTLVSGIKIGDGAVIAATATVTRSVGNYEIWGGNPACLIRTRFAPDITARLLALRWWDHPVDVVRRMVPYLSGVPDAIALEEMEAIANT